METEPKLTVTCGALMVLATAQMETAKDSVYRAIVGGGLAQVAVHENWGGAPDAARMTVKQVREATADAFGILKGRSQAALWLALANKIAAKLHKEMRPTLDAARGMETADDAMSIVLAAVRVATGGGNLGDLENWVAGRAKEKASKSLGERIVAALAKSEELTDAEVSQIAELVSQEAARRVAARDVAAAALAKREAEAEAEEEVAAAA